MNIPDLLDKVVSVALATGAVQLLMFFVKRRTEARASSVASDSVVVTSAEQSVALANRDRDEARAEVKELRAALSGIAERVSRLETDNAVLRSDNATLRQDNAQLRSEIAYLRRTV